MLLGAVPTPTLDSATRERRGAPAVVTTTVTSREPFGSKISVSSKGPASYVRVPIQLAPPSFSSPIAIVPSSTRPSTRTIGT